MLGLISRSVVSWLLVAGCVGSVDYHDMSATEHERLAQHYEATAASIELECYKARRNELTVDAPTTCWKGQDVRFLDANRDAAAYHRAAASELRAEETMRPLSAER